MFSPVSNYFTQETAIATADIDKLHGFPIDLWVEFLPVHVIRVGRAGEGEYVLKMIFGDIYCNSSLIKRVIGNRIGVGPLPVEPLLRQFNSVNLHVQKLFNLNVKRKPTIFENVNTVIVRLCSQVQQQPQRQQFALYRPV